MARKTLTYTVSEEGRDFNKTFLITEMPPAQSEAWAMRALLALTSEGVDLPEGIERMGMAGMAEVGIKALSHLRWEMAEPLLNEMWTCVKIIPDISKPHVIRELFDGDIEEIMTRIKLRVEIFKLHLDFLKAVVPQTSKENRAAAK